MKKILIILKIIIQIVKINAPIKRGAKKSSEVHIQI